MQNNLSAVRFIVAVSAQHDCLKIKKKAWL